MKQLNNIKPLVSIIIPIYNSEAYLKQTIQSALDQTWKNKEIIVVDNSSTDSSYAIANNFAQQGLINLYIQKKPGACATRNLGFEKSKGDYIQYLDADDLLSPDKIEAQLQILRKQPKGYIASCAWGKFRNSIDEAEFISNKIWGDFTPVDWLVNAWTGGGMMQTACWLTPRGVIESAGPWDESLKQNPNDDGEFFCRVLLKSSGIKFSGKAKVFYRVHNGERVSKMKSQEAVTSLLGTLISYEKNILEYDISPEVKYALALNYTWFIYQYYNKAPVLSNIAEERIKILGIKSLPKVGGTFFLFFSSIIGFKTLLKLRFAIKKI